MPDDEVEYFKPTSGRIIGTIGVVAAVAVVILVLIDGLHGSDAAIVFATAFVGVLIWAAMLRPRVGISRTVLVLRNMISEVKIPLAAIEQVGLRQVLAVRAGSRRFVSPALGRSLRAMRKEAGTAPDPMANYADFVEARIRQRMDEAREFAGIELMSDEQVALGDSVRRELAWPEVVALVVTGVGFVVSLAA